MNREIITRRLQDHIPHDYYMVEAIGEAAERREVVAALVGGAVRDLFLDRDIIDLDFLVTGKGLSFARSLAKRLGCRIEIFPPFDSAKLYLKDGSVIDIAGARQERFHGPGERPEIIGRADIEEDMSRRDFTVNSMALIVNRSRLGEVIDPYDGQGDVESKLIRTLHERSFLDDPVRILRAFRFAHRLGFEIEEQTRARAIEAVELLSEMRPGRWVKELRAGFAEPRAVLLFLKYEEIGVLEILHPETEVPDPEEIKRAGEDGHKILRALIKDPKARKEVAVKLHLDEIEANYQRKGMNVNQRKSNRRRPYRPRRRGDNKS